MQNIIKYSGLNDLSEEEKGTLKGIVEKEYPKIQRLIKNTCDLIVDVKILKKDSRKRFSISMRLEAPGKIYSVKNKDTEKGGDWNITKATHEETNALKFEIKHQLKTDTETWKKGGLKALIKRFKS
ncbi:hypothetical protein J4230_05460 [Candidatus Woesearchaeota archaeon]|nr:hypothetical protein [Candidatus Woesearchaeota archaeon]